MHYNVSVNGTNFRIDIQKLNNGAESRLTGALNGRELKLDAVLIAPDTLSLIIDAQSFEIRQERTDDTRNIYVRGTKYEITVRDARSLRNQRRTGATDAGPFQIKASMPGKVVRILSREGASLGAGQGILVLEAMKMQNEIRSPKDGVLKKMLAREGANVNAGEVLAVLE